MKRAPTIGWLIVAASFLLSLEAMADSGAVIRTLIVPTPTYVNGPRIIVVPPPQEERVVTHVPASHDDEGTTSSSRHTRPNPNHVKPVASGSDTRHKEHVEGPAKAQASVPVDKEISKKAQAPRLKPRRDLAAQPRKILNAPPPRVGSLTPIYPTPRFEVTTSSEKLDVPASASTAVDR